MLLNIHEATVCDWPVIQINANALEGRTLKSLALWSQIYALLLLRNISNYVLNSAWASMLSGRLQNGTAKYQNDTFKRANDSEDGRSTRKTSWGNNNRNLRMQSHFNKHEIWIFKFDFALWKKTRNFDWLINKISPNWPRLIFIAI